MQRNIRFSSFGKVLPKRLIKAHELDQKLGLPIGLLANKTGVKERHFVSEGETSITMAVGAAKEAIHKAGLTMNDIDLLIGSSGVPHQPIPCNAALIHRELGLEKTNIPAFDINSTCLSFITAVDIISHLIHIGKYRNVLIVSSEVASVGLNWNHLESAGLFGDGAAAAVLTASSLTASSASKVRGGRILGSIMRTYSSGADFCKIEGGLTGLSAQQYSSHNAEKYTFHMDGRAVFRQASTYLPSVIHEVLGASGVSMNDISLVIPHQASLSALRLVQKKLNISDEKYMMIVEDHGNTISACIPMCLYEADRQGRMKRGDLVLVFGTSAGFSIGAMVFEY